MMLMSTSRATLSGALQGLGNGASDFAPFLGWNGSDVYHCPCYASTSPASIMGY